MCVFKGHFPGNPILPGVFQIEMVRTAWEAVANKRGNIVNVVKAKFTGVILPGQDVSVDASVAVANDLIRINATLQVEQIEKATILLEVKTVP